MKTLRYIIIIMILTAGTAGIQAQQERVQETRRASTRTTKSQSVSRSAQVRTSPIQSEHKETPLKQTNQKQAVKSQRGQRPAAQSQAVQRSVVQKRPVEKRVVYQTAQKPAGQRQVAQRQLDGKKPVKQPVSVSTRNNPYSEYRSMATLRKDRPVNYAGKSYYSGHYYHHFYPGTHIKIHHHYETYQHHYQVLYRPVYREIYWTRSMYSSYCRWYPNFHWRYDFGYRVRTISIFETKYNLGEVANVYGRVYGTWHNRETDDYLLFFGGDFPNQEFTVVLPGNIARRFNWRPERFFLGEHITVTGLITTYEGIPEIIVKDRKQLDLY